MRPAAEVFEDNIGRVGSHPYLSSAEQARFERDRRIKLRDASRGDGGLAGEPMVRGLRSGIRGVDATSGGTIWTRLVAFESEQTE